MPTGRRSRIGRPSWVSRAASPLRAARGGAAPRGARWLGAEIVRRMPLVAFRGCLLEPVAEFVREFLEGAVLAGLSAGVGSAGAAAKGSTLAAVLVGLGVRSRAGRGSGVAPIAASRSTSRQCRNRDSRSNWRSRSKTGRPGHFDRQPARRCRRAGHCMTMPLQVPRAASAAATRPSGSSSSSAAISAHGRRARRRSSVRSGGEFVRCRK